MIEKMFLHIHPSVWDTDHDAYDHVQASYPVGLRIGTQRIIASDLVEYPHDHIASCGCPKNLGAAITYPRRIILYLEHDT